MPYQPQKHPLSYEQLVHADYYAPHDVLGAHLTEQDGARGVVIRALHPDAVKVEIVRPGNAKNVEMRRIVDGGLFEGFLPGVQLPQQYRLRYRFASGDTFETEDPYRFLPTVGETDLHLFNEGNHRRLWEVLGAHVREMDGVRGVSFAVWAPNARRVSVVGDFCHWDGRRYLMRALGSSGVWELFIPHLEPGTVYKYEIKTQIGSILLKTDPVAQWFQVPPNNAARVYESSYTWHDEAWMQRRRGVDHYREPLAIYEVHLPSWMRVPEEDNRPLDYREAARKLVDHVKKLGFTHIELLPVAEHPFSGSWGYQCTGYYAPTSRFGDPDDFRYFVDHCHQNGLGVIVDWVPAHFPKDDWSLGRFDGTPVYEHADPKRGDHPDWGTYEFNHGRHEVRSFLLASALYWLRELHVDGLRVDAVASMLYLDYSRKSGEWIPNIYGGNEDLEAIDFIKACNAIIHQEVPDAMMIAEESTAFPGVSRRVDDGGLGFTFKWNMGWMHDTLVYFSKEPVHRRWHHGELTFAMVYEYSEHFVMPLSHDEVVHGKGSLLSRMPGDLWQRFANLRTLLAYQYARPGKILLFMGTEIGPPDEWNAEHSLPWHLADDPERVGLQRYLSYLGEVYRSTPALWRYDHDPQCTGFIDGGDAENSVLSFWRRDGDDWVLVLMNLTPVPRDNYRFGTPWRASYELVLNSDEPEFYGSGYQTSSRLQVEDVAWHGCKQSVVTNLPPMATLIYRSA